MKIWVDPRYGLLAKMAATDKDGKFQTQLEVTRFTIGKPPASAFALPASCRKLAH